MARNFRSRRKTSSSEEEPSDSDHHATSSPRTQQRRPKKIGKVSSEEEEKQSSSEEAREEEWGKEESSSEEQPPPRHRSSLHRRPEEHNELEESWGEADSDQPTVRQEKEERLAQGSKKKHREQEESEDEESSDEPAPRQRKQTSPRHSVSQAKDTRRHVSTRSTRPLQERTSIPDPSRSGPLRGSENYPRSPPMTNDDEPEDALSQALKASKLEEQNSPKRPDWVEDDDGMQKAIANSERTAKKNPRREEFVDNDEEVQRVLADSKRTAKLARPRKEFIDNEDDIKKAIADSKRAAKKAPRRGELVEEEEQLRRALELSEKEPPVLIAQDALDDEELNRIMEASKSDAAEHEARLKEARAGKKRMDEVIKQSKLAAEEDRKKRKEAQKKAEAELKEQTLKAIEENRVEFHHKEEGRRLRSAWTKKREKEVAEEKRTERREQAEAAAREAASARASGRRPVRRGDAFSRLVDEAFEEHLNRALAESLGDILAPPNIEDEGWEEGAGPPFYPEYDQHGSRKINPKHWTTDSRDVAKGGNPIRMTKRILHEMCQYAILVEKAREEEAMDPKAAKPPPYSLTGSKKEAKALASIIKPSIPKPSAKSSRDAEDMIGTVRPNFGQQYQDYRHGMRHDLPDTYNEEERAEIGRVQRRQRAEARGLNPAFTRIPGSARRH